MTRWTSAALLLVACAVAAVLGGSAQILEQDHKDRLEEFTETRRNLVAEAARIINDDLARIVEDLDVAGQLVEMSRSQEDRQRELTAVLSVSHQYHLVHLYDATGALILAVTGPRAPFPAGSLDAVIEETVERTLRLPAGSIETTPPLSSTGAGWFRVFARAIALTPGGATDGVVAVVVDTEPLMRKLRLITPTRDSKLLVLGSHGKPIPASDPALTRAVGSLGALDGELPGLASLLQSMLRGESGSLQIGPEEALRLGLPQELAVAVFAPMPLKGAAPWSIATLHSTARLAGRETTITRRVAAAAAAVVFCLLVLGFYLFSTTRRAELLRERMLHTEQLTHARFVTSRILETLPTAVMTLSRDGRVTMANRAMLSRMGRGALYRGLQEALPDAPASVVGRLQSLMDAAVGAQQVKSMHGERLGLFGKEGQYSVHAVPLGPRAPDAEVLLVIEDQSEVRLLASQLLRAEKLSTVGVISAGVAHEIGTPLGIVRGRAEMVLNKLGADHPQATGLRVILEQIDLITRTIRQLLDFARVRPPQVHRVHLTPIARAVTELVRFEAERRKVALVLDVPESLPDIDADPDQVQQVLVNLVMNALDACEHGGRVEITARTDATTDEAGWRNLRLEVKDTGCGIPEDQRAQVFDPFFTTKKRGQGTGLGLTITAQIVRNHGGEIELESEVDKGTRVTVLWPLVPVKEERHAASAQGTSARH